MRHRVDDTKERLITCALQLFQEHGYPAVSIDDVTKAAGVTKGAFYYYLSSKEELLRRIYDEFMEHIIAKAVESFARTDSPRERLKQMIIDLLEYMGRYKANVTIFFRDMHYLSSEQYAPLKVKRDQYESLWRQVIRDGIAAGQFRSDLDPKIMTFALLGMCNWSYRWFNPGGAYTTDEIANSLSLIFLEGVQTSHEGEGGKV